MARSYEVGDRVKLVKTEEDGSSSYYFGFIIGYNSDWDDDIYQVSIEGKGGTFICSDTLSIDGGV